MKRQDSIFKASPGSICERLATGGLKEVNMLKTLSFAAVHFTVAFTIGYLLTGSVLVGGAMALVEPACNTIAYHFHEKAWARAAVRRARRPLSAYGAARY
jgi:uncharacterized membrane protein